MVPSRSMKATGAVNELSAALNRFLAPAPPDAVGADESPTQLSAAPAGCVPAEDDAPTVISELPTLPLETAAAVQKNESSAVGAATPSAPPPGTSPPPRVSNQGPVNLDEVWPAQPPKRQRDVPRAAIGVGGLLAVLVALSIYCSRAAHQPAAAIGASDSSADDDVAKELVVSEKDLKNRVPVTADYFRSRRPLTAAPTPVVPAPAPSPPDSDDDDRNDDRKRRDDDPEDLVTHRRQKHAANAKQDEVAKDDDHRRPFLYYPAASTATASTKAASSAGSSAQTIAAAGTVVSASLVTPINLPVSGGTTNVIAKVASDGPVPRGSRLIGVASAEDGARLTIRFTRLLLPDDREAKLDAEAQDDTGAFGVAGAFDGNHGARARGVAGDVAAGAAADTGDALLSSFTGGVAGGILRNAADRAGSRRTSSNDNPTARLQLAAGTQFNVFFHEAAVERR